MSGNINFTNGSGQANIGNIVMGNNNSAKSTQNISSITALQKLDKLEESLLSQARILDVDHKDVEVLKKELNALKEIINSKSANKESIWSRIESISKAFSWTGPILQLFISKFILI